MAPTPASGYTNVTHSLSQERDDGGDQSRRRLSMDAFVCLPGHGGGVALRPLTTTAAALRALDSSSSPDCSSSEDECAATLGGGGGGCQTPKGKQYRLPLVRSCPGAPRKPRSKSRRKVALVPDSYFTPDYAAIDEFFAAMESKLPLFKN